MAQFIATKSFEFKGAVRREGALLTMDNEDVKKEIALGRHTDTDRPVSGILNHCIPADDATNELCKEFISVQEKEEEPTEEDIAARVKEIQDELDKIGVAFHRGWKLPRLEKELKKAKKEKGL
jgi:hypothetical protein